MKKILLYITLFCCLSLSYRLCAADSVQYQHYTIDNGLPSNNVYECIQDHNGYIWITTDNGLLKYNGYSFKLFNTANANLPDNDIYKVLEDKSGRIWVYTLTNDFGYLKNDKYYSVFASEALKKNSKHPFYLNSWPGFSLFRLYINRKQYLLFAGESKKLIVPTSSKEAFIGCDNDGICILTNHTGEVYSWDVKHPFETKKLIQKFTQFSWLIDCEFWVYENYYKRKIYRYSPYQKDIHIIDIATGRRRIKPFYELSGYTDERAYTWYTASIEQYPFILVTNKYIYKLDSSLNIISKVEAIDSNGIQIAYKTDVDNSIWFSTNGNGVWVNTPNALKKDKPGNQLAIFNFQGIFKHRFSYWHNPKTGELLRRDTNGSFKRLLANESKIYPIRQSDDNYIYICTPNNVWVQNIHTGKLQSFFDSFKFKLAYDVKTRKIIKDNTVVNVIPLPNYYQALKCFSRIDDHKYLGSSNEGINLYTVRNDTIIAQQLNGNRFVDMYTVPALKQVFFFNTEHVWGYNTLNGRITQIGIKDILPNNSKKIISVKEDKQKNIYILTDVSLLVINPYTFRWKTVNTNFNLTGCAIDIFENYLIIAGRFGIAAANIDSHSDIGKFRNIYNVKDNLYKKINGLWVETGGIINIQTDKNCYAVRLDTIYRHAVQNVDIKFLVNAPFNQLLHTGDTVSVNQEYDRLILDAINFYGCGAITYMYSIGTDTKNDIWHSTISGEILFSNLQPGTYYHLKIKASDDVWKSGATDVLLYITPYWWQTHNAHIFFIISGSLILILAIIGIISLARQAVIRAQAKRRQLTELELRAVYSQINPHFIFNTLSTALYFIDRKDYDNAYKHVNKFSHLLRSYLKSSHDRYILLSEEIDMLKRYIELQQTRFENLFTYEVKIENRVPADHIQIPSLLLQPLVENAINHGLFHRKEQGGQLIISFTQGHTADELICVIEDNGIGRMRAMDLKKTNDAERTSYGSKLTDKLVDIFRQYEAMNIHIEYIDKVEPETGTVVRLTIGNVKYVV
ncbi:sensor histidine kinase [Chitinophagaceae bacterium MMS25-I14]